MVYEAPVSGLGAVTSSSFPGGLLVRRSPESARWPLPSAQRAAELPGLPGPRQGETRHSLPGPVTASWGVRDSSGGRGRCDAPHPILPLPPSSPASSPGLLGRARRQPWQVAWPLCLSPSCLTWGHHGLQVGCQASLGDSDRTGNAPTPPAPGPLALGVCPSSGRRARCRAAEAEGGRAAGRGRGAGFRGVRAWRRAVSLLRRRGCGRQTEGGRGGRGGGLLSVSGYGGGASGCPPGVWRGLR